MHLQQSLSYFCPNVSLYFTYNICDTHLQHVANSSTSQYIIDHSIANKFHIIILIYIYNTLLTKLGNTCQLNDY